jgi:NTE family protein
MAWIEEADGVFRGGGVKGLGIAGALLGFAEDQRYPVKEWVNVAGASAGAIMASYLAVKGKDAVQGIAPVLKEMPFAKFEDYPPGGRIVGGVPNLFRKHGMARGEFFRQWLDDTLDRKTFADVKSEDGSHSRLKVVAVDVTGSQLLLLPDDLPRYRLPGSATAIDPDSFPISSAVRMSMSIPYFFEPVLLVRDQVRCTGSGDTELAEGSVLDRIALAKANEGVTQAATFEEIADPQPSMIIDGGTLSNFPVWIFDVDPDRSGGEGPKRLTFGFTLTGGRAGHPLIAKLPWPARFATEIFHTAMAAWDNRFVSNSTRVRTVTIDAGDVGTTEFNLPSPRRDKLVESGRQAAVSYLNRFNPDRVVNTHGARPDFLQPGAVR